MQMDQFTVNCRILLDTIGLYTIKSLALYKMLPNALVSRRQVFKAENQQISSIKKSSSGTLRLLLPGWQLEAHLLKALK